MTTPHTHAHAHGHAQDPLSSSLHSTNFTSSSDNSEGYDANHSNSASSPSEEGPAPSSPSSSPLILYSPPTFWSIVRGAAINLLLPFVNGLMLGFGELFAHETAWRLGWGGTKVFPPYRNSRTVGPGLEMKEDVVERKRRDGEEMDAYTALE